MCSKSALKLFEEISKQCPEYVKNLFNFRGKYVKKSMQRMSKICHSRSKFSIAARMQFNI